VRSALAIAVALSQTITAGAAEPRDQGRWIEVSIGSDLLRRVDLDQLPSEEHRGAAFRHGQDFRARGVPLAQLWAGLALPPGVDLALLRFDNGVVIPIALHDADYLARLAPFVVRASASGRWASLVSGRVEDPPRPPTDEDLRPIRLHGNELLVSDPGLVDALPSVRGELRPFLHADSLHAIELIERAAWEKRFDAGEATREGRRVFLGSCAFCHAIRGSGGALGWDLVDPVPIYSDEWR
jgi:hypothetical protein